ncbi:ATP-binding protein [Bacteroidota bacterium]
MKVKLNQAVKIFFGNSSLEMVYIEAIANALDVNANKIDIEISAQSYSKANTLQVSIKDNGEGFTDERYSRFCNLFDVEESSHKGLGRLVFPFYFENIMISSHYNKFYHREFEFTEDIDEDSSKITKIEETESGTTINMDGYTLSKLKQYSFIQPKYLKEKILEKFYPRLYQLKQEGKKILISISAKIENSTDSLVLSTDDIPKLEMVELEASLTLIDKFYLHYTIEETPMEPSKIITAISVDNRTEKIDIVAEENLPIGYNMIFLLYSDWFIGKIDFVRQNLTVSDIDKQSIQKLFRDKVATIIAEKLPFIVERNKQAKQNIVSRFPHLAGYFNENEIGYVSYNDIVKSAQEKFFKAQREILGASSLSDEQYKESLELSSRALTEYILFRQITIEKLKKINKNNDEATIHNLIVPKYQQFGKANFPDDLYRNNAWVLDDKFMTYEIILSDKQMSEVVEIITEGEYNEEDNGKPDIALIFSNNPNEDKVVDVVIVELKKKGITLEENWKVITQLESRARRLMKHYKNKIQRIWFYGVVEFNKEFETSLRGEYTQLYSTGRMYYRETKVAIEIDPDIILPIGVFIMDLDSVVNDADARNSTFLNLIKNKFNQ